MSVSHLASSESHTGTTGSTTAVPFNWLHTPGGTARGVTVFVWTNGNAGVGLSTGVTYQGVTVPAVVGGEANRTTSEAGNMKVYHLGSGIPTTSPATVEVSRTGTSIMWACCCTQAAVTDTEYVGVDLLQSNALGLSEQPIDDGSPGSNSVRYGASHLSYDAVPPAGANSTTVASMSIDIGGTCAEVVVETVPGQGSRLVGMFNVTTGQQGGVYLAIREVAGAGVAHQAHSESHSDTIGSVSEASFNWPHSPGGPPKGVLIFVWMDIESNLATAVSYGGVAVPAIAGGEIHRVAGEEGTCQTFFLGAGVPASDPATVVVTRDLTGDRMWAVCATQAAIHDLEIYAPGILLRGGTGATIEESITDGSPGTNSQRYAGGYFAYDTPPTAGPNSTLLFDFDASLKTGSVVRETVPGQGARPVGWVSALAEEKAIVHLAVKEILPAAPVTPTDLSVVVYGYALPISPIEPITGALSRTVTAETIHAKDAQNMSVVRSAPTQVTFQASPDHATVTRYDAVLYTAPVVDPDTAVDTLNLGKPTPDAGNTITADLAPLFAGKAAGDYYIIIMTIAPGGDAPSSPSNVFTLPVA